MRRNHLHPHPRRLVVFDCDDWFILKASCWLVHGFKNRYRADHQRFADGRLEAQAKAASGCAFRPVLLIRSPRFISRGSLSQQATLFLTVNLTRKLTPRQCGGWKLLSTAQSEKNCRRTHETRNKAREEIFDYIEVFYNRKRRHSFTKGMSPMDFKTNF